MLLFSSLFSLVCFVHLRIGAVFAFGFGAADFGFKFTSWFGNFFTFLTCSFDFDFDRVPIFGAFTSIFGTFN